MRFMLLFLLLLSALYAKEKDSFITEQEYAKHLYKNPRGIGCNQCHGKKGEGMVISTYKHQGKKVTLETKSIQNLDYKRFKKALQSKKSVMPKYFLTSSEMKTLYNYLHKTQKK